MTGFLNLNRRLMLMGAGALGGSSLAGFAHPARAEALSLDDPAELELIFRKLAYSLDDKVGFWWLEGTRYGLIDSVFTPLWDMHVGTIFQTHDLPAGEYEVTAINISFYTDLHTGDFISSIKNPLTGDTIEIFYFEPKPSKTRFGLNGRVDPNTGGSPLIESKVTIGPAWRQGDSIWLRDDHVLHGVYGGRPLQVNDLTTYSGSARELADTRISSAEASQVFSDFNTWPLWLKMGDRPGSYTSRTFGRKVFAYEQMPATWRKLMAKHYPVIANDPVGALQG